MAQSGRAGQFTETCVGSRPSVDSAHPRLITMGVQVVEPGSAASLSVGLN